jgi:hypothetical protein
MRHRVVEARKRLMRLLASELAPFGIQGPPPSQLRDADGV